jgi:predicted anti-sigma-YlaC factor YlaD
MVRAVLLVSAVTQLAVGVWTFVSPGSFYDVLATYPPENDHFLKDVGAWNIALGLAALIAARTPSWQRGMLGVLAVLYTLHAVSHAIDLDQADPESVGVVTLVALIAASAVFVVLWARHPKEGART